MFIKAEDFKLVICDVRYSPLISQHLPNIPGVDWLEVPGTRTEECGGYQANFAARLPESLIDDLPEYCSVVLRYPHVSKLNVNWDNKKEVLEVCYQAAEGYPIESENF